ncbi:hypothetical protein HAX54_028783 [Datura stramonium]|uniref:Uncharacterized protein n=1 Tax=Datura stramonium TaxID=4076 RepID=A0ABS8V6U7_DATST|nr:hypothetical protein [Datura stramonium]
MESLYKGKDIYILSSVRNAVEAERSSSNGISCALGSAYLTSFLLTGGWNHDNVLLSLEANEKSVNRFLENYKRSLNGLSDAALKNPAVDALDKVKMMLQLPEKLEGSLQGKRNDEKNNKGKSTETSLASLIQSLATIDLNPSYNSAIMDLLTEGLNKGIAVIAIVWHLVKYEIKDPVYYVFYNPLRYCKREHATVSAMDIAQEAVKKRQRSIMGATLEVIQKKDQKFEMLLFEILRKGSRRQRLRRKLAKKAEVMAKSNKAREKGNVCIKKVPSLVAAEENAKLFLIFVSLELLV